MESFIAVDFDEYVEVMVLVVLTIDSPTIPVP